MTGMISVETIREPELATSSLMAEWEKATAAVRQRAFDYYQSRGGTSGRDLEDWLRAERDVIWAPRAEMTESSEAIVLRIDAAGLEAMNLRVTATPNSILIQADAGHRHDESNGGLCFCEFGEKLFRRFELPSAIDVNQVLATLDKGILQIVAKRRPMERQSRNVPISAQTGHYTN